MLHLQEINSKELKIILSKLKNQFGLDDVKFLKKYLFLKNNKKKIFLTTKSEKTAKLSFRLITWLFLFLLALIMFFWGKSFF